MITAFVEFYRDIRGLLRNRYLEQCKCGRVMYIQKTGWQCEKCGTKNRLHYYIAELRKAIYRFWFFLKAGIRLKYIYGKSLIRRMRP